MFSMLSCWQTPILIIWDPNRKNPCLHKQHYRCNRNRAAWEGSAKKYGPYYLFNYTYIYT